MKEREKSLAKINKKGIFYRIKRFIFNKFNKNVENYDNDFEAEAKNNFEKNENKNNLFMESIKNIENEETKILKLQKQYRSGQIKEEEMTQEQIDLLCALYDKQILNLKKSNKNRKKILRNNLKQKNAKRI